MTVTIEEAQAQLEELINRLRPGDQLVILRNNQPVAQLIPLPTGKPQPHFGGCAGKLTVNSDDDEHLHDFKEYMP